jgi:hypothetical protein
MPLPFFPGRSARPLVRAFHATRLSPTTLAQVYELLYPGCRRALPLAAPARAPTGRRGNERAVAS